MLFSLTKFYSHLTLIPSDIWQYTIFKLDNQESNSWFLKTLFSGHYWAHFLNIDFIKHLKICKIQISTNQMIRLIQLQMTCPWKQFFCLVVFTIYLENAEKRYVKLYLNMNMRKYVELIHVDSGKKSIFFL